MTIDDDKLSFDGEPVYRLSNATVYRSQSGFTFSKYLDDVADAQPLTAAEQTALSQYLEGQLQHNKQRFGWQVRLLADMVKKAGARVLDVGAGGGAFVTLAKQAGYKVEGVELDANRASYAQAKSGCKIHQVPIEDEAFHVDRLSRYDAVSLWDVIEHVNFPFRTLRAINQILCNEGVLLIDTPAKDTFYHRVGEITYRLSFGKFPTFLNIMYSEHPYGHKQIFSTAEMKQLLEEAGFEVVMLRKIHELSFPNAYYLKKMFKSDFVVKLLEPPISLLLRAFKIRNKMVVVARKVATS